MKASVNLSKHARTQRGRISTIMGQRGTSAIFPPSEEKHKKKTTDHHENMLSPYISKQNVDILTVLLPTTNIYPKDRSRHRKSWATSPTNQIPRFADRRPRHFPTKTKKKKKKHWKQMNKRKRKNWLKSRGTQLFRGVPIGRKLEIRSVESS